MNKLNPSPPAGNVVTMTTVSNMENWRQQRAREICSLSNGWEKGMTSFCSGSPGLGVFTSRSQHFIQFRIFSSYMVFSKLLHDWSRNLIFTGVLNKLCSCSQHIEKTNQISQFLQSTVLYVQALTHNQWDLVTLLIQHQTQFVDYVRTNRT